MPGTCLNFCSSKWSLGWTDINEKKSQLTYKPPMNSIKILKHKIMELEPSFWTKILCSINCVSEMKVHGSREVSGCSKIKLKVARSMQSTNEVDQSRLEIKIWTMLSLLTKRTLFGHYFQKNRPEKGPRKLFFTDQHLDLTQIPLNLFQIRMREVYLRLWTVFTFLIWSIWPVLRIHYVSFSIAYFFLTSPTYVKWDPKNPLPGNYF